MSISKRKIVEINPFFFRDVEVFDFGKKEKTSGRPPST